jgi:hypothetical protein
VVKNPKCSRTKTSDRSEAGLIGKVKSTITQQYTNQRAISLSAKAYKETTTAWYDTMGILEREYIDYNTSGARSIHLRKFDRDRKIASEVFHNADSSFYSETTYLYDSSDKLQKAEIRSYDREAGYQNSYRLYDRAGQCIERGSQKENTTYKYDSYGHCLQMTQINFNKMSGTDTTETLFFYDENCRLVSSGRMGASLAKTSYKYDDKDSLTEEYEEDMTKDQKVYISYKYDDHGNRIEEKNETIPNSKKLLRQTIMACKYEYDEQGNWIVKVIYFGGVEIAREERRIIYY